MFFSFFLPKNSSLGELEHQQIHNMLKNMINGSFLELFAEGMWLYSGKTLKS